MVTLFDRITDLIGLRDRDEFDAALLLLVDDLLEQHAQRMTFWRPVGSPDDLRWFERVSYSRGDPAPVANSIFVPTAMLARLDELPHLTNTLHSGLPQVMGGPAGTVLTVLAVGSAEEEWGVFEVCSDAPVSVPHMAQLGAVLRLYRNFQGLLDYGERDSLTNLLNRKTFDSAFCKRTLGHLAQSQPSTELRRPQGLNVSYWLGVIDIDHFKRVNDTYGHLIGDEVLILMARLIRTTFRFDDLVYRFGGEEFAVIVHCHADDDAHSVFERLRVVTQAHAFPQVGNITVSMGYTELRPGDTPSGAIERADNALYWAKGHGRNRVCSYASLIKAGELTEAHTEDVPFELF